MKNVLIIVVLLFSIVSYSQRTTETKIRPFRVDVRTGIPGILGLNIEYLTPALKNRIAFYGNYNGFNLTVDEVDQELRYFEIGTNIYLFGKGKGFYGSLSYGKLDIDGTYYNVVDDGGEIIAEATGEFDANTLNVKAGVKFGGLIYFRAEFGYGFGEIPKEVHVNGSINGQKESTIIERPDFPGMSDNGYVIANIGIGVSF